LQFFYCFQMAAPICVGAASNCRARRKSLSLGNEHVTHIGNKM
jgi:hypothetical protein